MQTLAERSLFAETPALEKLNYLELLNNPSVYLSQGLVSYSRLCNQIKNCLQAKERCANGVMLLNAIIDELPLEIAQQNVMFWIQSLSSHLASGDIVEKPSQRASANEVGGRYRVIRASHIAWRLLARCVQISATSDELYRTTALELVPSIVECLLKIIADLALPIDVETFECLRVLMICYPKPCGNTKDALERFLFLRLWQYQIPVSSDRDHSDRVCDSICSTIALLPTVGGEGKMTHAQAWYHHFGAILSTTHHCVDKLLEGVVNVPGGFDGERGEVFLPPVQEHDPVANRVIWFRRASNAFRCATAFLGSDVKEPVGIPIRRILDVCFRVCAVDFALLSTTSNEHVTVLASLFPALQERALALMGATMRTARRGMMKDGLAVSDMLISMATRFSALPGGKLWTLRVAVYDAIAMWLRSLRHDCCMEGHIPALLSLLLSDLKSSSTSTPAQTSQRRNALVNTLPSFEHHEAIILAVLNAMGHCIITYARKWNAGRSQEVLGALMRLTLQTQAGSWKFGRSWRCRCALYDCLYLMTAYDNEQVKLPYGPIGALFRQGFNLDESWQVRETCEQGLAVVSAVIRMMHRTAVVGPKESTAPTVQLGVTFERIKHVGVMTAVKDHVHSSCQTDPLAYPPSVPHHHQQHIALNNSGGDQDMDGGWYDDRGGQHPMYGEGGDEGGQHHQHYAMMEHHSPRGDDGSGGPPPPGGPIHQQRSGYRMPPNVSRIDRLRDGSVMYVRENEDVEDEEFDEEAEDEECEEEDEEGEGEMEEGEEYESEEEACVVDDSDDEVEAAATSCLPPSSIPQRHHRSSRPGPLSSKRHAGTGTTTPQNIRSPSCGGNQQEQQDLTSLQEQDNEAVIMEKNVSEAEEGVTMSPVAAPVRRTPTPAKTPPPPVVAALPPKSPLQQQEQQVDLSVEQLQQDEVLPEKPAVNAAAQSEHVVDDSTVETNKPASEANTADDNSIALAKQDVLHGEEEQVVGVDGEAEVKSGKKDDVGGEVGEKSERCDSQCSNGEMVSRKRSRSSTPHEVETAKMVRIDDDDAAPPPPLLSANQESSGETEEKLDLVLVEETKEEAVLPADDAPSTKTPAPIEMYVATTHQDQQVASSNGQVTQTKNVEAAAAAERESNKNGESDEQDAEKGEGKEVAECGEEVIEEAREMLEKRKEKSRLRQMEMEQELSIYMAGLPDEKQLLQSGKAAQAPAAAPKTAGRRSSRSSSSSNHSSSRR